MTVPKVVGGDLYHLWRVSEVHLPRIADVFYDATRLIGGGRTSGGETDMDAFRAQAAAYPGAAAMSSSIGAAWESVRDEMQRGFAQVGDTILDAAQGVRKATAVYLHTDAANADLLKRYLADPRKHDSKNPAANPPVPGADDSPGRPVLPY
jgi:hypothetical protein